MENKLEDKLENKLEDRKPDEIFKIALKIVSEGTTEGTTENNLSENNLSLEEYSLYLGLRNLIIGYSKGYYMKKEASRIKLELYKEYSDLVKEKEIENKIKEQERENKKQYYYRKQEIMKKGKEFYDKGMYRELMELYNNEFYV